MKTKPWWCLLQTLDEWCISNVAIRYRWWYHDCPCFLIDGAMGVPQDSLGNLGSYHELASMFMKIGGAAFGLMLPVFAGYVAYSIAENQVWLQVSWLVLLPKKVLPLVRSLMPQVVKQRQLLQVSHLVS